MKFVIMWIILPIVASVLILMVVVAPTASALGSKGYSDSLCHLNAGFRHWAPVHRAIPLAMCHEKSVTVDADNWNACDPDEKFKFKDKKDTTGCAAQQLYNLAARCWYMYGQGSWTMTVGEGTAWWTRYGCFKVNVRDMLGAIGENEITDASQRADKCVFLQNNAGSERICGRSDSIDFYGVFGIGQTEIKSRNTYHICFDERSTRDDTIGYDDNAC